MPPMYLGYFSRPFVLIFHVHSRRDLFAYGMSYSIEADRRLVGRLYHVWMILILYFVIYRAKISCDFTDGVSIQITFNTANRVSPLFKPGP